MRTLRWLWPVPAFALLVLVPWIGYRGRPTRRIDLVVLDKTVPFRNDFEHRSLYWLLDYLNVVKEVNRGLDFTIRYTHDFSFGKLTFDGQVTWQFEDTTQLLGESVPQDFNGSTVEPDFTGQAQIRFDHGDWTVFWKIDAFGKAAHGGVNLQGGRIPLHFRRFSPRGEGNDPDEGTCPREFRRITCAAVSS
jgi:hypothetical protein